MPEDLTEHASRNREAWAGWAPEYVPGAERNWATDEIGWGILKVPERELRILPDVAGKDVVELGCGTAYVSAWLARRGARVVGVDLSEEQLATARRMQAEHGLEFPLVRASAEDVPLPDASFDLAVSEYGASIWCDPDLWIAEAARLLRPGGELVFLVNGTLLMLTTPDVEPVVPAGTELLRPYFGMRRFEWIDDPSIDFHLGYGDWIRVLTSHGFEVERLAELRNPGHDAGRYEIFTADWAERWPAEEMWKARKVDEPLARRRLPGAEVPALPVPERGVSVPPAPPLLLASTSPQRRAILEQLGLPFEVVPPQYEEHDPPDADPVELVRAHAQGKARSVADGADGRPVLGVDTTVVCHGRVYGKAEGPEDAAMRLGALGGTTHEVVSGLCLLTPAWLELRTETTRVTFRPLTARDIATYVGAGEWEGRAGAYAIQGLGAGLVERIEGDYLNVVGLPAALLVRLLAERFPGLYGFG